MKKSKPSINGTLGTRNVKFGFIYKVKLFIKFIGLWRCKYTGTSK